MGLNRIAKISICYLCIGEIDLVLMNCISWKLRILSIIYLINHVSAETLTIGRMIPSVINSLSTDILTL